MEDIILRRFDEADFEQLLTLFKEFSLYEKRPHQMGNNLERMLKEKDYFQGFAAVLSDGQIIGYATFNFVYYTWSGKSIYMDDLYIKLEFRGKSIGSKLIQEVINHAKA
ncbi:MAG: GNAT superfamily N-acetyltransferase, partial [Arcticibacterium sp.]